MIPSRPALLALALAAVLSAPAAAQAAEPPAKPLTMQDVLDASKPSDWRRLDPERTLYLELDSGRVVIELAPAFAPEHVANIQALVREGYFDGLSINRSHDNFVVQWGDADGEDPAKARALGKAKAKLPAEFTRAARDPEAGLAWPAHCYGTVGAGRGMAADSSNGSELYVVTGQSPRQLDRNITTVGRVVQGMERLSVLARGTGALGFYEKAEQRTPIRSIKLASQVPEAQREAIEVFRTDVPAFEALVESRRNRRDDWYVHPAGHIDLCNIPVPVRAIPAAAPAATPAKP